MKDFPQSELVLRQIGPPKRYDNTMRTLFHQCQRKFYWWKIRQADYLIRPPYFAWGSAWHAIKGHWYGLPGSSAEAYSPEWKDAALEALTIGLAYWDNSGAVDAKLDTRENLIRLWRTYVVAYPNESWSLVKGGAELGWLWPLPTVGGRASSYFLGGSMDGYIEWKGFGQLCLEEKTTGIWLSDFFMMQWRFSSQITGYIWYLTQLLGKVHGALVSMATKQVAKATTPQFAKQIETRTEDDLLEFERDWRRDIEEIEKSWDRWHFPKTTDTINCTGGIGKSACPYKGLCLCGLPPHLVDPLAFPNLTLREEKWEPWKRSPGEIKRGKLSSLPFALRPVVQSPSTLAVDKLLEKAKRARREHLSMVPFNGMIKKERR